MSRKIRFYALSLMILFFMSSSGITVFKHFCADDGVSYGLFSSPDICMVEDVDSQENIHECCELNTEDAIHFGSNCCSEDINLYRIQSDLNTSQIEVEVISVFFGLPSFVCEEFCSEKEIDKTTLDHPPKVKTTSERLSLIQSYLI